jgi:hypothetical protein
VLIPSTLRIFLWNNSQILDQNSFWHVFSVRV